MEEDDAGFRRRGGVTGRIENAHAERDGADSFVGGDAVGFDVRGGIGRGRVDFLAGTRGGFGGGAGGGLGGERGGE